MSADALDRDLAALDPAPAYSPADADRAEHALALLLGAGVPKTRQPERGNRWRRWAVPATAAGAATGLAVVVVGDAFYAWVADIAPADARDDAIAHITLVDGSARTRVLTEWAGSGGRAALPYDPRFVPAVIKGAQAERARLVCTTKFAESPEQPAISKDAPALAVEKLVAERHPRGSADLRTPLGGRLGRHRHEVVGWSRPRGWDAPSARSGYGRCGWESRTRPRLSCSGRPARACSARPRPCA